MLRHLRHLASRIATGLFLSKPVRALVLLALVFQGTNFVFDWKTLTFRSQFTINEVVDAGDNRHYWGLAKNLLAGNGYTTPSDDTFMRKGFPTYLRSPGLPLFYMVPLFLFCHDSGYEIASSCKRELWWFLYVCNVLLLCLGAVYFYKLGRLLTGQPTFSFLGALAYIIWPSNLVFLSHYFVGTTADVLVTPPLIWIFYVVLTNSRRFGAVMAGLVLGYCMLTRVYLVLLPAFFLAIAFLSRQAALKQRLSVVALVSLIVLLPWPVRNYLVFHEFSLSSQGGRHLWLGNNASARGSYDGLMVNDFAHPERYPPLKDLNERYPGLIDMSQYDEAQASHILRGEAIDWMKKDASRLLWLLWRKLAITFYPTNFENGNKVNIITACIFLLFVPGFALHLYHSLAGLTPRATLLLATPIVCMCAVTLIYYAEYRARFVMEPFMILFAFYGVCHWMVGRPMISQKPAEALRSRDAERPAYFPRSGVGSNGGIL